MKRTYIVSYSDAGKNKTIAVQAINRQRAYKNAVDSFKGVSTVKVRRTGIVWLKDLTMANDQ